VKCFAEISLQVLKSFEEYAGSTLAAWHILQLFCTGSNKVARKIQDHISS
jgi:hypothetical protein